VVGGLGAVLGIGMVSSSDVVDDGSGRGPADWEDIRTYYPSYPYDVPDSLRDYPYSTGLGGLIKPDLCAPGVYTITTTLGGTYTNFSGTSAATPIVSGGIAVMLSADSTLTPEQIAMILETTAVELGDPGKDNLYGAGRLDVYAAASRTAQRHNYGLLTGTVRDAVTDSSLTRSDVIVDALGVPPMKTNSLGRYTTALRSGSCRVRVMYFGYRPDSAFIVVQGDSTLVHDVRLNPLTTTSLAGTVVDPIGQPLAGVRVSVRGTPLPSDTTSESGSFVLNGIPVGQPYALEAVRFNYHVATADINLTEGIIDTMSVSLVPGMQDDFETDQGWVRSPLDTATGGWWERGDPVGVWNGPTPVQPDSDYTSNGTICWLTQNCNPGATQLYSDVDAGTTTLLSPIFDGTMYSTASLQYWLWYSNDSSGPGTDQFKTDVSSDGGSTWVNVETTATATHNWVPRSFNLLPIVTLTPNMQIRFVASDLSSPSVVEAAVDDVHIEGYTSGVAEHPSAPRWRFELAPNAPNPFSSSTVIRFVLPETGPVRLSVFDVQGRKVRDLVRSVLAAGPQRTVWDGRDEKGRRCGSGVYLYRLERRAGDATEHRDGRLILVR
jgi:hypothetical protein